jgi:hypothetical protein
MLPTRDVWNRCLLQVLRKNSQRPGIYISDFQTADKAVVEELTLLEGEDVVELVVAAAVAPGANASTDRLSLPRMDAVKIEKVTLGVCGLCDGALHCMDTVAERVIGGWKIPDWSCHSHHGRRLQLNSNCADVGQSLGGWAPGT